MKVDTTKLKKGSSDLTPECRLLIERIINCRTRKETMDFLETVQVWIYGKCELYHWIEILDRFDKILEEAACHDNGNEFVLNCDITFATEDTRLLLLVLNFTTLLIEHSFSRHLYNSIEHLTKLLSSQNMDIVLAVLNLLYMFSKRSNFIPRLPLDKKETLLIKLFNIAERWGDPNYGLSLIDCCMKKPKLNVLYQLSLEYVDDNGQIAFLEIPDMVDVSYSLSTSTVVKIICDQLCFPSVAVKMRIAHRARLISGFMDCKLRLQYVQARLQAVSVLIYSNALQENAEKVLYSGFGEELCELIDKEDNHLVDIRAAVLRTLTSMLHFDRNHNVPKPGSRLPKIIHYTGAERQGGILPLLVRDCISSLTGSGVKNKYPINLATALFSLLYHLASYEAGGQALLKSGMMQSLLCVINWADIDLEHITFVTRAVRVIDLITNIDIAKFHQNNGLNTFIDRLEKEVKICREAIANAFVGSNSAHSNKIKNLVHDNASLLQDDIAIESGMASTSYMFNAKRRRSSDSDMILLNVNESPKSFNSGTNVGIDADVCEGSDPQIGSKPDDYPSNSYYARPLKARPLKQVSNFDNQHIKKLTCTTQRAALLKSMLNFLKKSIQDHTNYNGMRNVMETTLPCSLRHIISKAEYYGPSLFLLATDVVTVYVFNEPSLLSSLQDYGITNVILQSLLKKEVPATREVLGSLPNVFSALCLNERGLLEFMAYEPFDKLFNVLLSPDYLVAMRRRRSSDPLGDTATNLGNAMDDLMKHHPYLRTDATEAIVRLLNELVRLGTDPNFICWRANRDNNSGIISVDGGSDCSSQKHQEQNLNTENSAFEDRSNDNEHGFSGEEDDDDEDISSASQQQTRQSRSVMRPQTHIKINSEEREAIPLIDYILNVMKFIEAIFSNSSNGEHCREFALHGGLKPLIKLLSLPNLPVDSPVSTTAQAVANVCKSILNLAHETKVIDIALLQLSQIVTELKPLINHGSLPGGSVLLCELLACPKLDDGFCNADYTPLLHNMSSVHGYVVMLVHICRNASPEMRSILLQRWGLNCSSGLQLLQNLVQLYISLVWESTVLLNLCSDDPVPHYSHLDGDEIQSSSKEKCDVLKKKNDFKPKLQISNCNHKGEKGHLTKTKVKLEEQLRYIKSLLAASSRLGRALAELFGTLVKLSVGTPQSRQRRNNDCLSNAFNKKIPSSDAKEIARVLSSILVNGFCHETFVPKSSPKLKLTFLICSVGFTGPMLFDDKRNGFHLMISQFCKESGLQAFFNMFSWAISIGNEDICSKQSYMNIENISEDRKDDELDFPEGTGEFLDAWLQLLEKMVNPRAIIDSPYALATVQQPRSPESINFEPIFYLVKVHQLAMLAIKRIWKRKPISNYGVSMTETIMTILKHLIKSNKMLSDRFITRMNEISNENKLPEKIISSQDPKDESTVNADHLKILTDMGFLKQHVHEALNNTRSIEQATDYLLNHSEVSDLNVSREAENVNLSAPNSCNEMEVNLSALPSTTKAGLIIKPDSSSSKKKTNILEENKNLFGDLKLIPNEIFSKFCFDTQERVFSFMEFLPETVNTGADLLSMLYRYQNQVDKSTFLTNLVKSIIRWSNQVLQNIKGNFSFNRHKQAFVTGMMDTKLFIRFKIATLLLDDIYSDTRKDLFNIICKENCLNSVICLLNKSTLTLQEQVTLSIRPITPRWLQSLVEFVDAVDSVNVILQRKINMRAVCSDVWKWYDTSTGKWNIYSDGNNTIIKNAFNSGERSVVITIGRQRYTVNFSCMTQVSEASGSHRPVMPALKITEAIAMCNHNPNSDVENILTNIIKSDVEKSNCIQQEEVNLSLNSLLNISGNDDEYIEIQPNNGEPGDINSGNLAKDLQTHTNPSKKMQTKEVKSNKKPVKHQKIVIYEEPIGFAKHNTAELIKCIVCLLKPSMLLNFETKLSFLKLCARLTKNHENAKIFVNQGGIDLLLNMKQSCGLIGFPTYAIIIIRHILETPTILQESIERVLLARTAPSLPIGHRDLLFVLTQVSSAVARNPQVFLNASKQILRCDYAPNSGFSFDDSKFLVKAQVPNNRKDSALLSNSDTSNNASVKVIKCLLNAIVQPCIHYGGVHEKHNEIKNQGEQESEPGLYDNSSKDPPSSCISNKLQEKYGLCCCSWHIPSTSHNHEKPVLPRATIIKVLADAVRSYQSLVPRIIIEHIYKPSDSILIEKEQTCLSFILENFLPIVKQQQDAEVSIMSRVLISSLVDCYGYTFIQSIVAEEVHKAIVRAIFLPDSTEKNTRLQVLLGLLPTMIESPMLINKVHVQRNNMYRVLLRQGIMTDLSKIAQYSDLSKSSTFASIFATLRPMEILLRLTVAPGALSAKRLLFGNSLQGTNQTTNRRFFPRLAARSATITNSNTFGGDHVLRDIIRNVLSDRRHGFEFIFNPENIIVDSESTSNAAGIRADDAGEDIEQNPRFSSVSRRQRSQLNFDRLLDDYMQNERNFQNLTLGNRNTSSSNSSAINTGIVISDHHRHTNNLESVNNDNGEGGSDGASTSSEIAAVTVDNIIADVSTSDSNDSDSNISTENDDRNDEENEEDDDEDDGNEECADDPSETDAEDETRQFIEVFDHIYERESSETASNYADVDADDEASELGGGVNRATISQSMNTDILLSEANISNEDHDRNQFTNISTQQLSSCSINTTTALTDVVLAGERLNSNDRLNDLSTTVSWDTPRMTLSGEDVNIDGDVGAEYGSNISNGITPSPNALNDRYQNSIASGGVNFQPQSSTTNSQNSNNIHRRDSIRRLLYLDQQYCAPMPSFNSPTEEGQIELFNQDALHWWLEEAKQLDFESQTNACLYVGHFLIPYLINEFKTTQRQNKKHENPNTSINSACTNRRSSIPVLMQHVNNSSVSSDINPDSSNNRHVLNTTLDHFQESSSASESIQSESLNIPPLLNQNNVTASSLRVMPANIDLNSDVFVFDNYNAEERLGSTPLELSESTIRAAENSINETLEISTNNHNHNQEVYTSTYGEINTRLVEDEAEATDDDINDENKEDEMNTTFIEDELNVDLNTGIQNVLLQSRSQSSDDEIVVANAPSNENNENSEIEFNIDLGAHGSSVPPVTRNIINMENNDTEVVLDLPVLNTETSTGIIINSEAAPLSSSSGSLNIAVMSSELRATLGGLEVPDGVDPSFLAALPEEMREEVIQEFLRMQRVRQRAQQNAMQVAHDSLLEVSPEFLAALPPNIQSEVLMQQRIEQQRQAAQTANPEDPVDTGAFFQNLPDSLRQAILTDMDESQIASLPPELAAEAQYLRRDWENRNNMRLDSANSINALRSTARGGYLTARFPSSLQNLSEDSRWRTNSIWYDANGTPHEEHHHHTTIIHQHPQFQGKPIALLLMEDENKLLDPDSLTTLLLFLFIEDSKLNFTRLQRIIRNLCYHVPTREWIINALISIIQRTKEEEIITHVQIKPQWLNLRVEAVLGYKSNIFVINKINDAYFISINPQAVQTIVHNCLEMLFVLAKYFPRSFVPYIRENKIPCGKDDVTIKASSCTLQTNNDLTPEDSRQPFQHRHLDLYENSQKSQVQEILGNEIQFDECPSTSRAASAVRTMQIENTVNSKNKFQYNANAKDFWDVLLNIDINTQNRFCNLYEFPMNSQPSWKWEHKNFDFMTFNDSIFAKLTEMLAYKVICRSPQLTDMLIKLLALLSADLPKDASYDKHNADNCETLGLKPHNTDVVTSEISSEVYTTLSHEDKQDLLKNEPVKCNKSKRKLYTKNYSHLKYVIEVLTHRCGTTEGLDNVAKLIFNLCQCSLFFNAIFLQYLTSAILGLAKEVQQSIQNLLSELRCFNLVTKENATETKWNNAQQVQGIMHDRFTAENIVISAPTNIKPSFELQLPAMKKLLSTTSAQPYFLRTLKILIQVRELSDMRKQIIVNNEPTLSQIIVLDNLWSSLSECLIELEGSKDEYAVLVLQPTVEAFFLIHATRKESSKSNKKPTQENNTNNVNPPSVNDENVMDLETNNTHLSTDENITKNSLTIKINSENLSEHKKDAQLQYDRLKFLSFAEKHRTVLNQILRQSPIHLSDGPFAVLVDHTRILDFDVKRKYFQTELERIDEGVRREESTVSVRRVTVFEDSFRVLYRLGPEEWKNRFYIVFEDEEGQDAGGLLREWYVIISREIFNPMYALFCVSPGDRVTYMINPSSYANPNHLSYFKFVGRVIAKAIHDNKLLECYFTRSFYKHILGKHVKYTDMESQDYEFYKGLDYLMKNNISTLGYELTFSTEVQEFGVTQVRDLIPKGRDIVVTEENKFDYVQLVCQLKMSGSIRQQLDAFLEGFYDIIPKHLISIFNEQELELLISGLPDIDIEDLKANTEYHKYTSKSAQIQWFWRALRSFDQADRAKFLQFVTGTSKVPLQGFRLLEGMNGIQKFQIHRDDRSTDRLPCAHTCFNQLDLPMYKSYEKLRTCLLKAIHECSEGFGFA